MAPLLKAAGASLLALPVTLRSTLLIAALYPVKGTSEIVSSPPSSPLLLPQQHLTCAATYSTMASTDSADDGSRAHNQKPMLARHRAQQEGQAPPKGGYFPLTYKDGFSQWWAGLAPTVTENRVLSFVPYLQRPPTHTQTGSAPASASVSSMSVDKDGSKGETVRTSSLTDPYGPRQWHSQLVQLAGKGRFLNEFSVERVGEETENNLVMLHGYGAGLGFFYKNFEALSRPPHWKLYALDMLGMGRSSRPPFRINAKDKESKVREAENWFIDALEEWRIKRGINKFTLLGHSLGGYMAVCYALKYPGHVNKLILASPVGIPEDPYAVNEEMPDPENSTMGNEFTQTQDEVTENGVNGKSKPDTASSTKPPRKPLPKWLTTLWDANISPFSLVRLSGPLGPRLVSGWTSRRFSHLAPEEAQALHDYSYSLFRQRGSGEYALAYVLAPGAFARSPLIRRIQGVGRQYLEQHATPDVDAADQNPPTSKRLRETGIPVVMMYGENDWMDVAGGFAAEEKLKAEKKKAIANASKRETLLENGEVKVKVILRAGHHLYIDNSKDFNEFVVNEMRDVEKRQQRLKALA